MERLDPLFEEIKTVQDALMKKEKELDELLRTTEVPRGWKRWKGDSAEAAIHRHYAESTGKLISAERAAPNELPQLIATLQSPFPENEILKRLLSGARNRSKNEQLKALHTMKNWMRQLNERDAGLVVRMMCLELAQGVADRLATGRVSKVDDIVLGYLRREEENAKFLSSKIKRTELERQIEAEFTALTSIAQATAATHRWDYFISYPQKARDLATAIFKKLDGLMRVFMDYFCLIAGQHWDRITPDIQAHSRGTIVIVTPDTALAHFQQSEIHLAINLHRAQGHKIIPIYTDPGVPAPFGLQQIHGIVASKESKKDILALLVDHLKRNNEYSLSTA